MGLPAKRPFLAIRCCYIRIEHGSIFVVCEVCLGELERVLAHDLCAMPYRFLTPQRHNEGVGERLDSYTPNPFHTLLS